MKVRVIITGATGMVGEGVLMTCLQRDDVEQVLVVNRRPCNVLHPKLKEIIHKDFFDLSAIAPGLKGYNACFFCLGVSSVGMKEKEYSHLTYDLTTNFAETLAKQNEEMVFCYVSGGGTDSTEKGRMMWARVKGKTENVLMRMPFRKAYMFRPGYMQPSRGAKNVLTGYKPFLWLYPVWRRLFPKYVCTLEELGTAMIHTVTLGYEKPILEVPDIVALAAR